VLTANTLDAYCTAGARIELKSYAGASHTSVIGASQKDVAAFFAARLSGQPALTSCAAP